MIMAYPSFWVYAGVFACEHTVDGKKKSLMWVDVGYSISEHFIRFLSVTPNEEEK